MILRLLLLVIFISSINCKSIVNPHNFSYLHNPGYRVCKGDVYLLVYVHSSPGNYKRRTLIRETWASQMIFPQLRLVFMLGKSIESKVMKSISYESAVYHDIVQEDFIDAYKNLTYKGIMALKWTATYCERAKFVLKADDDILVNTYTMIRHLENLEKHMKSIKNTLFCLLWRSMPVLRDSDSKWYVSKDEFPMDEFPPYCSGSAFILTNDMPKKMYEASLYIPFFWVDDYHITGAIAGAANISYYEIGSLYAILEEKAHSRFTSTNSFYSIMFGHFPKSMDSMQESWSRVQLMEKSRT